jgi:hypothetical protein
MNPPAKIIPLLDDRRLRKKGPLGNLPTSPKGFIPLVNASDTEIYIALRGQNLLQYPPPIKLNPSLKFSEKYC